MKAAYATAAHKFLSAGMAPIPLDGKRPIIKGWQNFSGQLPDQGQVDNLVNQFGDNNIGVVCGEASGINILDIDTKNEELIKVFMTIIKMVYPNDYPWMSKGAKGFSIAFLHNPNLRSFSIRSRAGEGVLDYLSNSRQKAVFPSWHPDTGEQYWENAALYDVKPILLPAPDNLEALLRGACGEAGIELSHRGWTKCTDWIAQGQRDNSMVSMAGFLSWNVLRGELSLKQAMSNLFGWYQGFVEKVAGDELDVEKGQKKLIEFLARDVIEKGKLLPHGWDDELTAEEKSAWGLAFAEEHKQWSFEEYKDYLRDSFEKHPEEGPAKMRAIEFVFSKIASAQNLTAIEEDQIHRFIIDTGGVDTTIATLRRRVRELAKGPLSGDNHTEIAKAVIKDYDEMERKLRFDAGGFWAWNGAYWEGTEPRELEKHIQDRYGTLQKAQRYADHIAIVNTMRSQLTPERESDKPSKMESQSLKGINFANGFLDENLYLQPHNPDHLLTYMMPFRYLQHSVDITTEAPKFWEFITDCWGTDKDFDTKVQALREAICVTIFGAASSYQRVFLLFGPGRTGKSQMLAIVESMLPENTTTVSPPDTWRDKFSSHMMFGKLLNSAGELSNKKMIDGQKFKSIVAGDPINAQQKMGQLYKFVPKCAHWFASNYLYRTDDPSSAFARRWLIFAFNKPVPIDRVKPNLGSEIAAEEREVICSWAAQMWLYLENREVKTFTEPPSHREWSAQASYENDAIQHFLFGSGTMETKKILESDVPADQNSWKSIPHTGEGQLWNDFLSFTISEGVVAPVSYTSFKNRLRDLARELNIPRRIHQTKGGAKEALYFGVTRVTDGEAGRNTSAGHGSKKRGSPLDLMQRVS